MSDFDASENDELSSPDLNDGGDDTETFGIATQARHSEIHAEAALSLQKTRDRIKANTTNEFIIEAVEAAAMLRNMLGDADGVVADNCSSIISNLMVVSTEVSRDPIGFLLSFARAIEDDAARKAWVSDTIKRLQSYVDNS